HLLSLFDATTTTMIYTLSLHDALPISPLLLQLEDAAHHPDHVGRRLAPRERDELLVELGEHFVVEGGVVLADPQIEQALLDASEDRKSTRLNSSHVKISYAVFCLKKKK